MLHKTSYVTFYTSEPNPKDISINEMFFDDTLIKLSPFKLVLIGMVVKSLRAGQINKAGFWKVKVTIKNPFVATFKLYHIN